jgi:hypothetical protein
MEQLGKSFLEDFSSHQGALANWFELDKYAKLLEKRGETLSKDKNYKEANEAKAERKKVLVSKDTAKSCYDNATQLKDCVKRQIDECQKKIMFTLKVEYKDLLCGAKKICAIGDTYDEHEPECLDLSNVNHGNGKEEEDDATSTEGNVNKEQDGRDGEEELVASD